MRSLRWLAAALMVGFAPLVSSAQETPDAPPSPAEAPPAPTIEAQPAPPAEASPPAPAVEAQPAPSPEEPAPPGDVRVAPPPVPQPPPRVQLEPAPRATRADPRYRERRVQRRLPATPAPRWPAPANAPAPQKQGMFPGGPGGPDKHGVFVYQGAPVKGTYLGVATSSPPEALQRQLQLKPGVGLVVEQVEPESPADQAGVKQFDVLWKLDDQLLVNPEQLLVLVRTFKAGDEVKLTVIRGGQPQVLTAKLVERDVPPMRLLVGDMHFDHPHEINVIEAPPRVNLGEIRMLPADGRVAVEGDVIILNDDGQQLQAASIVIEDAAHRMSINSKDGKKHLRVEDKSGGVVFDGPIETEEELGKVPTDVRDKIEKMGLQRLTLPEGDAPLQFTAPGQPQEQPSPDVQPQDARPAPAPKPTQSK